MKTQNDGHILQIVLCLFLVMSTMIVGYARYTSSTAQLLQEIKRVDQERLVEIYFARYLKHEKDTSVLLSDHLTYDHGEIAYAVLDMGEYDQIKAEMTINDVTYHITAHLTHNTLRFIKYSYDS